jgi:hypothetical protein
MNIFPQDLENNNCFVNSCNHYYNIIHDWPIILFPTPLCCFEKHRRFLGLLEFHYSLVLMDQYKKVNKCLVPTRKNPHRTPWEREKCHSFAERMGRKPESLPQVIHLVLMNTISQDSRTEPNTLAYGRIHPQRRTTFWVNSPTFTLAISEGSLRCGPPAPLKCKKEGAHLWANSPLPWALGSTMRSDTFPPKKKLWANSPTKDLAVSIDTERCKCFLRVNVLAGDVFAHTFSGFVLFEGVNQAYSCYFEYMYC